MSGRFGVDDLERRADMRLGEVPDAGAAVPLAKDDVNVERGLALLDKTDVAVQRGNLDLFVDRVFQVLLGLQSK